VVNILHAARPLSATARWPYSSILAVVVVTKLFEQLPKSADLDKPRFCCSFDEAPPVVCRYTKSLVTGFEQIGRPDSLQGRGVYFVTSEPAWMCPERYLASSVIGCRHAAACRFLPPGSGKL